MREVKTESLVVNVGTGLLHVSAERVAQRFLKQMRGGVVARRRFPFLLINRQMYSISLAEQTVLHVSHMADLSAW